MSRYIKILAFFLLGLALFLFVWQRAGVSQIILSLKLFCGLAGITALFCFILFNFVGIIKWQKILKSQGNKVSFKQLGDIWLAGSAISYFTPFAVFGGEIFEIYFLEKRFKGVKKPLNMASVAVDKLLDSTVFFIILICGVLALAFFGYLPNSLFSLGLFLSAGLFLFILLVFYLRRAQGKSALEWFLRFLWIDKKKLLSDSDKAQNIFLAEENVFKFFSFKNKALWYNFALTFLKYSFNFLRVFVLIFFLTGEISFLKPLAVLGFLSLAALTPSPAALGSLELACGLAFSALGLGFDKGVVFSAAFRLADVLIYSFGLLLFARLSAMSLKQRILEFFHR